MKLAALVLDTVVIIDIDIYYLDALSSAGSYVSAATMLVQTKAHYIYAFRACHASHPTSWQQQCL